MPIRNHKMLSTPKHAIQCQYGVLVEISLRYPPVTGRLHTRYAPVRRSSPEYCYPALPLDLHVLSLPLAFILSQDQTLHCKNCSFYLLTRLRVYLIPKHKTDTRYLSLLIRFNVLASPRGKRLQKYNLFPFYQNIFSFFFAFFLIYLFSSTIFFYSSSPALHPVVCRIR